MGVDFPLKMAVITVEFCKKRAYKRGVEEK